MKKLLTLLFVMVCLCGLILLTACTGEKGKEKETEKESSVSTEEATVEPSESDDSDQGSSEDENEIDYSEMEEYQSGDWSKNY